MSFHFWKAICFPSPASHRMRFFNDAPAVEGGRHAPWHEGRVVVGGCSERQPSEQPDQIAIRLDAVCLARLDEGVQVGTGLRVGDSIGEQPALAVMEMLL